MRTKYMQSRLVILPYKMGSASARDLANNLSNKLVRKVRRVRHEGLYRPRSRSLVVNYGSGSAPAHWPHLGVWLNNPHSCGVAGNKLTAFRRFKDANLCIPEFTTDRAEALSWIGNGSTVVARTVLNGHSGRGIVLAADSDALVQAPLYVRYKKKRKEFRVHVFQGQIIDKAEKRRMRMERRPMAFDGYIRNLANGWVFCRSGVDLPRDGETLAIAACNVLGLDFGAVDVIWNEKENKCYLLEVNTAPGLQGTTLESYYNAIYNWMQKQP